MHFHHLGAEKMEFEVSRSFINAEKGQFSIFFTADILILRHPVHFKSFFLLSDDVVGMKYLRKNIFF